MTSRKLLLTGVMMRDLQITGGPKTKMAATQLPINGETIRRGFRVLRNPAEMNMHSKLRQEGIIRIRIKRIKIPMQIRATSSTPEIRKTRRTGIQIGTGSSPTTLLPGDRFRVRQTTATTILVSRCPPGAIVPIRERLIRIRTLTIANSSGLSLRKIRRMTTRTDSSPAMLLPDIRFRVHRTAVTTILVSRCPQEGIARIRARLTRIRA
jgi:hypothetical protein